MKTCAIVASFAALAASADAFAPVAVSRVASVAQKGRASTRVQAKSEAMPFMEQPANCDGSMAGDVGFDPLGLSSIDFDFSQLIVPGMASQAEGGLSTMYWMREAELKHSRVAMLATLGWVAVDLGVRFPGAKYADLTSATAHDPMVASGNLPVLFVLIGGLEVISGAAIYQAAKGSGREPGQFYFDPMNMSKDPKKLAGFQKSEIKNGRLAMLAFSGICTQAVLTGHTFPYLF